MDNRIRPTIKVFVPMMVSLLINTFVAGWAQVVGLVKHRQQSQWVKTEHSINHLEDMTVRLSDLHMDEKESDVTLDA